MHRAIEKSEEEINPVNCHKLKGTAGTLGLDKLYRVLKDIEAMLKIGSKLSSSEVSRLADVYTQTVRQFNEIR